MRRGNDRSREETRVEETKREKRRGEERRGEERRGEVWRGEERRGVGEDCLNSCTNRDVNIFKLSYLSALFSHI